MNSAHLILKVESIMLVMYMHENEALNVDAAYIRSKINSEKKTIME